MRLARLARGAYLGKGWRQRQWPPAFAAACCTALPAALAMRLRRQIAVAPQQMPLRGADCGYAAGMPLRGGRLRGYPPRAGV
ncbi:MAG: hypothetical protein II007_00175 [Gammaproteobacteria bacterium]|nr:hypothetical protein [Gammaproteobacteria bacterium]